MLTLYQQKTIASSRLAVLLALVLLVITAWSEQWQCTILHTNDLHGMMRAYDYPGAFLSQSARKNVGGLARRATAIAQIRKAAGHSVIVLDAGDVFTRGPWHTQYYGEPEIEALNLMAYDLLCVGNNEFKATHDVDAQEKMLALMRRSSFPWVAANLTVGDTGKPVEGIRPYVVKQYGAVRVGFLGLTAPRAAEYAQTKGWTITDPIAVAKEWTPRVRKECDILIALTHIGYSLDLRLAAEVPGIDAIVGGDSHTFLRTPTLVNNPAGVPVPIVQAGEQGIMLGQLVLTFEHNDAWRLTKAEGSLILLDHTFPDDPAVKALLDRYLTPVKVNALPALRRRQAA